MPQFVNFNLLDNEAHKQKNIINSYPKNKYVKIMPDYMSTGLWDSNGMMLSWCDIFCGENRMNHFIISAFAIWINEWENLSDLEMREGFEINSFFLQEQSKLEKRGERIAKMFFEEFPNFTVDYLFDNNKVRITEKIPMFRKVRDI